MSAELVAGANLPLGGTAAVVVVEPAGACDVAALLLASDGKVRGDDGFVFYNQPSAPGVQLDGQAGGVRVDLGAVPDGVDRIAVVASLDGSGATRFSEVGRLGVRILDGGTEIATYAPTLAAETAAVLVEVYRRDAGWKARAVGQGWSSGLAGVATSFGVEIDAPAAPEPAPSATTTAEPKVQLGKVTLDKRGAERRVSLHKDGTVQPLHFNLNWSQQGGLLRRAADLDLGCMYEMADGSSDVIQPLGGNFGSRDRAPFIHLDKDDRSGAAVDGENLHILRPDLISRVMVFALVYEGASDFRSVDGRLTIRDQAGNETLVRLDAPDPKLQFCAICLVERSGDEVRLVKEERYFRGHRFADAHYGFGFEWTRGRK